MSYYSMIRPLLLGTFVVLGACEGGSVEPEPEVLPGDTTSAMVDGVRFTGHTKVISPPALATSVTMLNTSTQEVLIEFGGCGLRVFAFMSAERTGQPNWDSAENRPPCPGPIWQFRIAPGGTATHTEGAYANLAAAGEGRFYFVTRMQPNGKTIEFNTGNLLID